MSEHKARLGWEIAGEERRLNLVHASHERAATLWIGGEVYRNSLHDPASRQVYVQAAGTAHQQHAQAIGAAYNTWAQTVGQTFQSWQQEGGAALQGAQTDNGAAWQSFAQAMPTHKGALTAITWEDLQIPEAPFGAQPTDAEKALEEAMKKARTQYRTALQSSTTAWQKATNKATKEHRDGTLKDDEAASQLRKANRAWLTAALTALEDLRADCRSALRKHQLATTPE
ncbi:MAG: hypothetical protein HY318_13430 [Armatimonadetes bacterium]|nr:hypothetical protein [Armatimonadota bacterium]